VPAATESAASRTPTVSTTRSADMSPALAWPAARVASELAPAVKPSRVSVRSGIGVIIVAVRIIRIRIIIRIVIVGIGRVIRVIASGIDGLTGTPGRYISGAGGHGESQTQGQR
jgi:hypothetical protein